MTKYFSNELFHFVGKSAPQDDERNFKTLKSILSSGYVSHPPHRPGPGETTVHIDLTKELSTEELIVPTVVCFCDIPVEHLSLHMQKYGRFGVALDKAYLIHEGARPVMYIPFQSDNHRSVAGKALLSNLKAVYQGFREHIYDKANLPHLRTHVQGARPTSAAGAASALDSVLARDLIAFLKPFNSEIPEDHPDYYYAEREWRKYGNQVVTPETVRRVIVPDRFVTQLEKDFPQYAGKIQIAT